MDRSSDWLRQAERDLESARLISRGGFYEWACFISQQDAEEREHVYTSYAGRRYLFEQKARTKQRPLH